MLRLFATLTLLAASACEDDGPNSEHCVEQRMKWLELDYRRRELLGQGYTGSARAVALQQDLIVSGDMPCFPGFMLTTE